MNDQDIRQLVADALRYASVPGFDRSDRKEAFLAGEDVAFTELEIDSLAAMELCIAIEASLDVTVLPAELPELGSLNALLARIAELRRAEQV